MWRSVEAPLTAKLELQREAADAWFLAGVYLIRRANIRNEFDALSSDEAWRRIAYSREYFEGATSIRRHSDEVRHTHSAYLASRESGR